MRAHRISSATIEGGLSPALVAAHFERASTLVFLASGHSMWPALAPGASVEVHAMGLEELPVGAVVLLPCEGALLLHRVLAVHGERLLIKGDNNRTADGWYAREEILGRLPRRRLDRVFALLSRMPGQPIPTLWAIWRRLF